MWKVVRKAIVRKEETYTLYLDDEYVAGVNKYLQDVAAEEIPTLTASNIVHMLENKEYSDDIFEKEYKWVNYRGDVYTQELWEKVDEIINDDLWDCEPYEDYVDTEDIYTDVYEG